MQHSPINGFMVPRWGRRGAGARLVLAGLLGLLGACAKPAADAARPRAYDVRGIVRAAPDPARRVITIEHEDVPGFMPAMTMQFDYRAPGDFGALRPGDGVAFQLWVTDQTSWISAPRPVPAAEVRLPVRAPTRAAGGAVPRLREGDRLPEFALVDQDGQPLGRATFAGRALVVTFIFTRCPIPNFCPLMAQNFQRLQEAIKTEPALAGRAALLSISFDEFDTPPVLKDYGSAFGADVSLWRFATGTPAEVQRLTRAFAVHVEAEGGTLAHSLTTALIDRDGTIRQLWRGNGWQPAEVLAALRALPSDHLRGP